MCSGCVGAGVGWGIVCLLVGCGLMHCTVLGTNPQRPVRDALTDMWALPHKYDPARMRTNPYEATDKPSRQTHRQTHIQTDVRERVYADRS